METPSETPEKRRRLTEEFADSSSSESKYFDVPIINDPIHGVMALHPLLMKIINTPQFARLKDIKQLGVSYWIYPGASHNRFEHSIGTSYLCGKMIDTLRDLHSTEENGKIEITDEEVLCVKVAGLCHDLGHGPFSHFFDRDYIPMVKKNDDWSHEKASCDLFKFMLRENQELQKEFEKNKLEEKEQIFIQHLILGEKEGNKILKNDYAGIAESAERKSCITYKRVNKSNEEKYKKSFLFEIVNNERNGIDCDKFDYFARDCHNVGVQSNFDWQRYFHTTRIMPVGDELQICVRDKEVFNLYELFHTRSSLHQRVCQHKTEAPIKDMLAEALSKVDEKFGISSSIDDMSRYTKLTDSIVYEILRSDSKDDDDDDDKTKLKDAKELLLKIQNRQLYKFCGEIYLSPSAENQEEKIKKQLCENDENLSDRDIFVSTTKIGKREDPIESVNFFDKLGDIIKFPEEQLKQMRPALMVVRVVRVYAKSEKVEVEVKQRFEKMCEKYKYPTVEIIQKNPQKVIQPDTAVRNLLDDFCLITKG